MFQICCYYLFLQINDLFKESYETNVHFKNFFGCFHQPLRPSAAPLPGVGPLTWVLVMTTPQFLMTLKAGPSQGPTVRPCRLSGHLGAAQRGPTSLLELQVSNGRPPACGEQLLDLLWLRHRQKLLQETGAGLSVLARKHRFFHVDCLILWRRPIHVCFF